MNKLPKEKRAQVLWLIAGIGMVMTLLLLWFAWNSYSNLKSKTQQMAELREKVRTTKRRVEQEERFRTELATARARLSGIEERMATGDEYLWIIRTLNNLLTASNIDIANFDPPRIGELETMPKVPYRAATFSVQGTAYYHEFGKFLAEFENSFPYMEINRVELSPNPESGLSAQEGEKLSFKMEFVTLIKPGSGKR